MVRRALVAGLFFSAATAFQGAQIAVPASLPAAHIVGKKPGSTPTPDPCPVTTYWLTRTSAAQLAPILLQIMQTPPPEASGAEKSLPAPAPKANPKRNGAKAMAQTATVCPFAVVSDPAGALLLRGSGDVLKKAIGLVRLLDTDRITLTPGSPRSAPSVLVIDDLDPDAAPSIQAALNSFVQGAAASSPASTNGGTGGGGASAPNQQVTATVTGASSGTPQSLTVQATTPTAAPTTPSPPPVSTSVIIDPSQTSIIVHADPIVISLLKKIVVPRLRKAAYNSQDYETYEVKYAVPNPVPLTAGSPLPATSLLNSTLVATSSVQDLVTSVQSIINQQGISDVRVIPDTSYPRILVAGSKRGVQHAMELLSRLDRKPAIVDIEAKVYEIDVNRARNLGFSFPSAIQTSVSEYFPPTAAGAAAAVAPTPSPVFLLGKVVKAPITLGVALNFLVQNQSAWLLDDPRVEAINGRSTVLNVQNTIPFVATGATTTGATIAQVNNYTTGTRLEIIPLINVDGGISAYFHPAYTTLTGFTQQGAPQTSLRETITTFRLQSGVPAYISGLNEVNVAVTRNELPLLRHFPVVGPLLNKLLTNTTNQTVETQLFIVLTATIVDPGDLRLPGLPIQAEPSEKARAGSPPTAPTLPAIPSPAAGPPVPSLPPLPQPAGDWNGAAS